jgi:hypothetical protein
MTVYDIATRGRTIPWISIGNSDGMSPAEAVMHFMKSPDLPRLLRYHATSGVTEFMANDCRRYPSREYPVLVTREQT